MNPASFHLAEKPFRLARDPQGWGSLLIIYDLNVVPGDLTAPARFQRLKEGFLRRKPRRIRLSGRSAFGFAIYAFGLGEDTLRKSWRSGDGIGDTVNFDYVDAG